VPIKADYSIKNYGLEPSTTNTVSEQTKTKETAGSAAVNNIVLDAPKTNFTYDTKITSNATGNAGVNPYVPYTT